MNSIKTLPGTRDILPDEIRYWQNIEEIAKSILKKAAYREIRTPIFEQTSLFERGIGEATDVVGKEMYTFKDKGDRSTTLRPEGTAGVVRAFIQNSLYAQVDVQRLWYAGRCFATNARKKEDSGSSIKLAWKSWGVRIPGRMWR